MRHQLVALQSHHQILISLNQTLRKSCSEVHHQDSEIANIAERLRHVHYPPFTFQNRRDDISSHRLSKLALQPRAKGVPKAGTLLVAGWALRHDS
jgi:hypothetical protein